MSLTRQTIILGLGLLIIMAFGAMLVLAPSPAVPTLSALSLFALLLLGPIGNAHPHYVLYMLVFLIPFTELLKFSDQVGSVLIVLGGLVFVLWWKKTATGELTFRYIPGLHLLLLFGLLTLITTLMGDQPINGRTLMTLVQLWLLAFLTSQLIQDPAAAAGMGYALTLSATLVALTTFFGSLGLSGLSFLMNEDQMRARSLAGGINPTSALIASGIAFATTSIRYERGVRRWLQVLFLLILWLGNLATVSLTGAFVGVIVTATAFSGLFGHDHVAGWLKLVMVLSCVVIALLSFDAHLINDRLLPRIDIIVTQEPIYWFSTRGNTWFSAFQVVLEHPLAGTGIGHSPYHIATKSVLPWDFPVLGAHNLYLTIAAESGLLALGVYLALFVGAFEHLRRSLKQIRRGQLVSGSKAPDQLRLMATAEGVLVALFGTLAYGFALDSQSKFMWLLLGLSMAVGNILTNEVSSPALPLGSFGRRAKPGLEC